MSNFLFLLRTYAELDHLTPLMWKCLEKDDRVMVIAHHTLPYHDDYRIRFLETYPGFEVLRIPGANSSSRLIRLASRLIWTVPRAHALLERYRISACFVASRSGVGPPNREPSLQEVERGRMARAYVPGRVDRQILLGRVLKPLSTSVLAAARESGVRTFCLPHGVGTRLTPRHKRGRLDLMRQAAGGTPPPDWRAEFTSYVFASELHRQREIEHGGLDPTMAQAWGSLRFSPQWLEVQDRIIGDVVIPSGSEHQLRVLCLVPKPHHLVERGAVEDLLLSLARRGDVLLVVKPDPSRGGLGDEIAQRLQQHSTVWLAGKSQTSPLIRNTDVTIVEGSSVAIEALVRGKHLIYMSYFRPLPSVYDESGGCLVARAEADVHTFLNLIVRHTPPVVDANARARLLSDLVYGGSEPFDVPEYYYAAIQRYLSGSRPAAPSTS